MTDQQKLLIILQPNNVERKERTLLNAPINIRFYGACIACTVIDVILIFLSLLGYFYPNPFRRTPLYKQIFQKLDRFTIQFWYSITLLALTIFFFLHFVSVGGSLLSIQIRKPLIFIPQLIFCLLAVLLQLLLFSVCITISIVSDDTMWGIAIFSLFLLFLFGIYLAISVFTFKQLLFECDDFKKMLANSKSVHFKEENKRKK
uniref:Transmembrane protein n=3 Tax=Meloidogyne TaxID=189290 RepID=A0A914N008_MELIC